MTRFERWLRRHIPLKELGWPEIGEKFTRFILLKTRWVSVYLHKLDAPIPAPLCHNHPWHFWVFCLGSGYWETINGKHQWIEGCSVFYRTARSLHGTTTVRNFPNWSIVVVSHRKRDWRMQECRSAPEHHWLLSR